VNPPFNSYSPGVFRNDRFWLAIDHTVDPRINDQVCLGKMQLAIRSCLRQDHLLSVFFLRHILLS
jgi:hypothetical protein